MKTTKKAILQAIRDGKATDISRFTEKQLETLDGLKEIAHSKGKYGRNGIILADNSGKLYATDFASVVLAMDFRYRS